MNYLGESYQQESSAFQEGRKDLYSLSWWIEIKTILPFCIYYFGPFESQHEAMQSQYSYIEDLIEEKAHGITVEIKRLQPKTLTIFTD